jgi:hypothetical protein
MRMICWRTVACVSIFLGLPLIYISSQADAAVPPAKCQITVNYPNVSVGGNGWFGYRATFQCQNHVTDTVRVTFQIIRANREWRVLHAWTSPVQFTTQCRRGGPPVDFRPRVTVSVQDIVTKKRREFVKAGPPYTWRCLPR